MKLGSWFHMEDELVVICAMLFTLGTIACVAIWRNGDAPNYHFHVDSATAIVKESK